MSVIRNAMFDTAGQCIFLDSLTCTFTLLPFLVIMEGLSDLHSAPLTGNQLISTDADPSKSSSPPLILRFLLTLTRSKHCSVMY